MAYAMERKGVRGTKYTAMYRDPEGRKRSAGTYSTRREAMRVANREEQRVLGGSWHDTSLGESPSVTTWRASGCPTSTSKPPRAPPTSPT